MENCLGPGCDHHHGNPVTMSVHQLVPALQDRLTTHPVQTLLAAFVSLLFSYIVINEVVRYTARVPGMKGPPGLPLIGNLWSIRSDAAAQYYEWSKKYGDVYQVQMGNVPVVVVNSAKAAKQLWAGQVLSSRPVTYTFHKVRNRWATRRDSCPGWVGGECLLDTSRLTNMCAYRSRRPPPASRSEPLRTTTPSSARRRARQSPSTGPPSQATCPT